MGMWCVLVVLGAFLAGDRASSFDDFRDYRRVQSTGSAWTVRYGRDEVHGNEEIPSGDGDGKIRGLANVLRKNIDDVRMDFDRAEIVFLVDTSSSVGEENFRSELNFVRKLLSDLRVEQTATRVAVITFGDKRMITRNIDQITSAEFAGDKCRLLNQELRKINYTGGGTYTKGALLEALTILRRSRHDTRKLIFLITDGFSNGGDPRPVAEALKSLGAVILTFGIRTGNVRELHDIASKPVHTHSYFLDSFQEFESLARHALHRDLKEGKYVVLKGKSPCEILCDSRDAGVLGDDVRGNGTKVINQSCCDDLAECACGTSSGHYSCLCPSGYYGSGLRGNCHPCPNGTYGHPGLPGDVSTNCLPCPSPNHITLRTPATSPHDCICDSNFIKSGATCHAITCPKLRVPDNGYLVKASACNNVVNAACGLRCRIGFKLVGDSIRLCRRDGQWSGREAQCLLKTCPVLRAPAHGDVHCEYDEDYESLKIPMLDTSSLPIDTRCQFRCSQGYQLLGSKVRNCLPVSRWDGLKVTCKQIRCDPLKKISHGFITPDTCLTAKKLPFGTVCRVSCQDGFDLEGPAVRKCMGKGGLWSQRHSISACVDRTPPVIRCPPDSTWSTAPGKRYSLPRWEAPEVGDNSEGEVEVWTKPHLKVPWKAKIGVQVVTYVAQDISGNRAKCKFRVETLDKEPPQVTNCINPPTFITTTPQGVSNITWDDPVFYDNSRKPVKIRRSHHQGTSLPVGITTITYTATDVSKNIRHCSINITVRNICAELPPISNGHLTCDESSSGVKCLITCDDGYIFPLGPPTPTHPVLTCSDQNIWNNSLTPSCAIAEVPEILESTGTIVLDSIIDICTNSSLLESLKSRIHQDLVTHLPKHCAVNGLDCHTTTVDLNCTNLPPNVTKIVRRSTTRTSSPGRRDRIEVTFKILSKIISDHRRDPLQGLQHLRSELLNLTTSGKLNLLNEKTNREIARLALNLNTLFSPHHRAVCDLGKILRRFRCVKCPLGTFHNVTTASCQSCGLAEYQDVPGSVFCNKCSRSMSTRRTHSTSRNDCVNTCPPGHYSRRRYHKDQLMSLEPCVPCDVGSYQPLHGSTSCLPCPRNTTTNAPGSADSSDCRRTDPTDICHVDFCLNNGTCVTDDVGVTCDCLPGFTGSRCQGIRNPCDSSPCHSGTCQARQTRYVCTCPDGFTGLTCDTHLDECSSNPCRNNATCVSDDNDFHCVCRDDYGGEYCDIPLDMCQPGTCDVGSTCVIVNATWSCLCRPGFLGRHCDVVPCDWLPCHPNAVCVNLEVTNTTHESFRCDCPPGLKGDDCRTIIDHCQDSPCGNSGVCVNNPTNFTCRCSLGFDGVDCRVKMTSDFVLNFDDPGVSDFVIVDGPHDDLHEFTVCFWILTTDTFNYGTVFSYATAGEDNTVTLTDYNGLVFYVNGDKVITDVRLNDGIWHFVCVMWRIDGKWWMYVDGVIGKWGQGLSSGKSIPGNGTIVIGQEQDYPEGGFSPLESFVGSLTLVDVWPTVLPDDDVTKMMNSCAEYSGGIVPWSVMRSRIRGNVRIQVSPICRGCPPPVPPDRGTVRLTDDGHDAVYTCESGYELWQKRSPTSARRRCLKRGQWEGEVDPVCRKIHCGFPGYFPRGRIVGSTYDFNDEVVYACAVGYDLRGNPHRVCGADGRWTGRPPICVGVTCRNLLAPVNGDVDYIIEEHERDDVSILQVGQQLEFRCDVGYELVGEGVLTCSGSGQWDHEVPECLPRGCRLPTTVVIVDVTSNVTDETFFRRDEVILVSCRPGFTFGDGHQVQEFTCSRDGSWRSRSDCRRMGCEVPDVRHGRIVSSVGEVPPGGEIHLECEGDFKPVDGKIVCEENGGWSVTPECRRLKCPGVSTHPIGSLFINKSLSTRIERFTLAIEGDKPGDQLVVRCRDESKLMILMESKYPNVSWTCGRDEKWRRQPLPGVDLTDDDLKDLLLTEDVCEIRCPSPTTPAHAVLVPSDVIDWKVNVTVDYVCKSGFVLQGKGTAICTSSGTWSGLSLCRPIACGDPPMMTNAKLMVSGESRYAVGDVVMYDCLRGFRMFGQRSSRCLESSTWSRVQGQCARISCGKPRVSKGVKLEGKSYLFMEELGYDCGDGRKGVMRCLEDGVWGGIPDC
ncbi:sushi, von Willebrand factor type A, EGF and pentraxin domain-containing protein 1-like [Diachasmimorpha longicaudata]|uniref:sushi, von Willebrand factor type A, EGF and pentraxin domain-containing protein 1-like n=1 Tax=Diachasmimorpha longicaudata TaxID=58733 RepID=UPI0030B87108